MNSEIYGHATNLPWAFIFAADDNIPRHPTQIYEALCYVATFFSCSGSTAKRPANPWEGFSGWFLVCIFTARFVIEFLKEPQVMFEQTMLLNMGQLLSMPSWQQGIWLFDAPIENYK